MISVRQRHCLKSREGGVVQVGVGGVGGVQSSGFERKQDKRDRESARAEEKATMSREKGSIFFKKRFSFTKRTLP